MARASKAAFSMTTEALREEVRWAVYEAFAEQLAPEAPPAGIKGLDGFDTAWLTNQLRKREAWLRGVAKAMGLPEAEAVRRLRAKRVAPTGG